jgi:GNAT superfamily N-acetyltransferase
VIFVLKKLTCDDLGLFRTILGGKEFGGCFCAVWHSYDKTWEQRCQDVEQPNYFSSEELVKKGMHLGYLVYLGETLIGWTGSGPIESFPLMKTKLASRLSPPSSRTWSVGCLAVASQFRGQNLAAKIVLAVIEEAKIQGAESLEAYPVRPNHEPRLYRGSFTLYEKLEFREIAAEGDGDHDIVLMRRDL